MIEDHQEKTPVEIALEHVQAVNKSCNTEGHCVDHLHCPTCNRHLCPVCGKHYYILIYSENEKGCCTNCYKEATGDTEPWKGPVEVYKL